MCSCNNKQSQKGGNWMQSFHAQTAVGGPAAISHATLQHINSAPMFNPLTPNTTIPTGPSTGIIPNGMYFAQMGGSNHLEQLPVQQLRSMCNQKGLSCKKPNGKYFTKKQLIRKLTH